MASKAMPQILPETPGIPGTKQCSKGASPLELPQTNNSCASALTALPGTTTDLSKSSHKPELNEQKPDHRLKEPVDAASVKFPVEPSKKAVAEHGSTNGGSTSFQTCGGTSQGQAKVSASAKAADPPEIGDRGNSGRCRPSTSSDISDESSCSSMSNSTKPHKANDSRWEAIQTVRTRDGVLGLSHFRLLKRLGCGDIGSVYLSELNGTKSYFAMKVMDKASLASRKKLLRAQTEKEILQCLDHPFLPTLYTHFETDKFSCLVMEFCPGGDLHALRQRQPGKHFPEQAVKFYIAEVLLALEYLHMLGIIYRDLKPENVLVREDGHIMLSDFDLSLRCAVSPTLIRSSNPDAELQKRSGRAAKATVLSQPVLSRPASLNRRVQPQPPASAHACSPPSPRPRETGNQNQKLPPRSALGLSS